MPTLINQLFSAFLTGMFIGILSGCEVFGNLDGEEPARPQFRYEIYDENGELLKTVTHERVGEVEIETSLGIFGENFIQSWVADSIGNGPDDWRQLEIWLHAEKGITEDVHFATLNFSFTGLQQWEEGTYRIYEISKEEWLGVVRKMWEFLQHRDERYANAKQNLTLDTNLSETEEHMIQMNYNEFGFGIEGTSYYMFLPTEGHLELENVSGDHVEGNFSADMVGLPAAILTADKFPEDPEFQTYHITGDFVAEHGDYNDLLNLACVEVPRGEQLPQSNPFTSFGCYELSFDTDDISFTPDDTSSEG